VPQSILTDRVVERVLTEGCVVPLSRPEQQDFSETMDVDTAGDEDIGQEAQLAKELETRYSSSAQSNKSFRIPHSTSVRDGTGSLVVPGWILSRAVEILFEDEADLEADTVPGAILATLLKVSSPSIGKPSILTLQLPVDVRPAMISNILVTGGTPSLPGFIPRLRNTLAESLDQNHKAHTQDRLSLAAWKARNAEPYRELYGLSSKLAIINDPAPVDSISGTAPRWTPSLMSWVGGSLAGYVYQRAFEMVKKTDGQSSQDWSTRDHSRGVRLAAFRVVGTR
jgi:actin-related protein 10